MILRYIADMAYTRARFVERVDNEMRNVVTHLCLIRYANLSGNHQNLVSDGKSEVRSMVLSILSDEIKGANNRKVRLKAVLQGYDRADMCEPKQMRIRSIVKMEKEGIPVPSLEWYSEFKTDLTDIMLRLANAIADQNVEDVKLIISTFS